MTIVAEMRHNYHFHYD